MQGVDVTWWWRLLPKTWRLISTARVQSLSSLSSLYWGMDPLSTRETISAFVSRDMALSMGLGLAVSVDGRLTACVNM